MSEIGCLNVACNDISVIYVTAHRCAGKLKKKLGLRSGSQYHRHFVGFFIVPVHAPTRDQPFNSYSEKPPHFNPLFTTHKGYFSSEVINLVSFSVFWTSFGDDDCERLRPQAFNAGQLSLLFVGTTLLHKTRLKTHHFCLLSPRRRQFLIFCLS